MIPQAANRFASIALRMHTQSLYDAIPHRLFLRAWEKVYVAFSQPVPCQTAQKAPFVPYPFKKKLRGFSYFSFIFSVMILLTKEMRGKLQ